jgi:hypothetical protein
VRDRFLADGAARDALLARVRAAGVGDAVDAAVDFA